MVSFAPGGVADIIARTVDQKLSARLGQPVVVENRPGAGGNIAGRIVAGAPADGYTVLVTTTALAINETLHKRKGFAAADLVPVAIGAATPEAFVVNPGNPAKTMTEFLKAVKDKPVNYGTAGVGTGSHITAEYLFKVLAKVPAVHVPFQGGGPAVNALLGNHVDAVFATLSAVVPHITSGKLRGMGIADAKRNPAVPDVPIYAESGYPNFYTATWVGFFVPAKTDPAIVARLNATFNEILKDPAVQARLKLYAYEPSFRTPAETVGYFNGEVDRWGKMVTALGLSVN
jgi:tripartite-type tricarboxylate transporter receptor subunit TctC